MPELRALHYLTFFISTLCIGIELEALHFAECIVRRRDAHLRQSVGEIQRDGIWIFARTVQQIGKTLALVTEVDGAVRGRVPGGDGMVVLHGVDAGLVFAVYLYGEQVARVEHAARAVRNLADARLRCAPGLRFAALHAEGDTGYLKGVLSFVQAAMASSSATAAG
jgi:hypothetical protein